ncbi:hypothetical protein J0X19_23890 [Hymenobacter sp. BT186]|uniref:Uncharacterized protein n=1 Tax=Hymenobacter telluris TaxID=2816474 RepID=A0A939F1H6_9BACT|nr:hypothetical protein [Hymenobacter telluris]MBO0361022.1 hypothetical protein [Hymenobacter telluris]MBW3377050.1 hypothetical protein [Hymenobacter norwichensis]
MKRYKKTPPITVEKQESFLDKHFSSVVVLTLGLLTTLAGQFSGLFDVKKKELEVEKASLELKNERLALEINRFEDQKRLIQTQLVQKRDSLIRTTKSITQLSTKLASITSQYRKTQGDYLKVQRQYTTTNQAFTKLKKEYDTPIITITGEYIPNERGAIGITLKNQGTGPILIDEYIVYTATSSMVVNDRQKGSDMVYMLFGEYSDHFTYYYCADYCPMSPGDKKILVGINPTVYTIDDQRKLTNVQRTACLGSVNNRATRGQLLRGE